MKYSTVLVAILCVMDHVAAFTAPRFVPVHGEIRRVTPRFASKYEFALLFDCDGVILETEELHRLAYNEAFKAADLTIDGKPVEWSVEYYDVLQNTVGGGKPKMFFHFRNTTGQFPMVGDKPAPATLEEQQALIDELQAHKTEIYRTYIEEKAVPRPGVIELMDEALADPRIAVGVCSASTKGAVQKVLAVTLGEERQNKLDVCILGDDVSEKKPSPMIYNEARSRIGIDKERCVVVEDSMVGLRAAKAAVSTAVFCVKEKNNANQFRDSFGFLLSPSKIQGNEMYHYLHI